MINKLSKEEIFLSNKDLKLKKIIKKNGHLNLQIKNKDPFNELVEIMYDADLESHKKVLYTN